jgi:aspartate/methionine/tyrosine aminotransferase
VRLFSSVPPTRSFELPAEAHALARHQCQPGSTTQRYDQGVDDLLLETFAHAERPDDPYELRDLYIGRVEAALGASCTRPDLAMRWRNSKVRRQITAEAVLRSRVTPRLVKELFNFFFRDDLYGILRPTAQTILSSGAVDELGFGLPESLKDCVRYALARDWYGYSDSRGRESVRDAIAAYESARVDGVSYSGANVAITMGVTFAINVLADFLFCDRPAAASPALCAIPNYPPLVQAVARRTATQLVPLAVEDGCTSLDALIDAITPQTPLILLQTVTNPTGSAPTEDAIARLVAAAPSSCWIVLDESHEWLGPEPVRTRARGAANVIRVNSASKAWSVPGMKLGWMLADSALIDEYYEFASTSFGGPPSLFYTCLEMLARMERWRLQGIEPSGAELAEFEPSYNLELSNISLAFASYCKDRIAREDTLRTLRDATVAGLTNAGAVVLPPRYSINLLATFPGYADSYLCFRELLRDTGVAVFPGVLMFASGGGVRITTSRQWPDLLAGVQRLESRSAPSTLG